MLSKVAHPIRARSGVVAILIIASVVAILNAERFLIDAHDSEWAHIARFKWFLLAHGIAGLIALVTGAAQFSTRTRGSRVHRVTGRIYVVTVVVASLLALYINAEFEPWPLKFEVAVQATLWLGTTTVAYIAAKSRQIDLHRRWMVRSYAITFIFIASRLPIYPHLTVIGLTTMLWYLSVGALVIPDLIDTTAQLARVRRMSQ